MDAALTAPVPVSAARRPQQDRSRETEARILRALAELLRARPFERLSVADVAERAGVSVGGFYARFASKHDALLHLSYEGYVAETAAEAARVLAPGRWRGRGIAPVAEAYFRLVIGGARRHFAVIRELVQRSRADPGGAPGADAYDRFVEVVHEPFRRLLRARLAEVRHPDPELALRVGFSACHSAAREAVLFPHMRPVMGEIADERLAAELARMFCGYLGAPLPDDRG
ncbi:MAG TPA: helix-turn-helix domain-containing protein [Longimicrobium sp.]|jgi:AcrR family transcriptional regulator